MFSQIITNLESADGLHYRSLVDQLAVLGHPQQYYVDMATKQTPEVQKKVYSIFTFMVQKYIRCLGKEHQIDTIPFEIGLIWHHTSLTFNLPTVTTYSALVLSNWTLIDPTQFPSLENLTAVHGISGLQDEFWFYRIHIAIEYTGGQILQEMFDIEETTATTDSTIRFLQKMRQVLVDLTVLLGKMRTGCDPKTYWNDVRIFLGGYTPDNGLPNGINIRDTPFKDIKWGGGSGAQSSLIQSFDEFLGVEHSTDHAREFLRIQRTYMPAKHAAYLTELATHRPIREIVLAYNDESVTAEYNTVMMALGKFRAAHYRIVYEYIVFFTSAAREATTRGDYASAALINKNNIFGEGGTGGTVLKMLEEYRRDTVSTQIKGETEESGK